MLALFLPVLACGYALGGKTNQSHNDNITEIRKRSEETIKAMDEAVEIGKAMEKAGNPAGHDAPEHVDVVYNSPPSEVDPWAPPEWDVTSGVTGTGVGWTKWTPRLAGA